MKYDLLSSVISHRLHYNRINISRLKVKEYVILVVGEGDEWEREKRKREEKSGRERRVEDRMRRKGEVKDE